MISPCATSHTSSHCSCLIFRTYAACVAFLIAALPLTARSVLDTLPDEDCLPGYESIARVTSRMAASPLHDIEGIWEMAGEGTLMAIERDPATDGASALYRMIVINSATISTRQGTVMGYLTPTSRRGSYDARIYTALSDDHRRLIRPSRNVITISDDGSRITFKPYGRTLRFNWWRLLLPYMYRSVITPIEHPRGDLDGCVRVYPAPAIPLNPRYL